MADPYILVVEKALTNLLRDQLTVANGSAVEVAGNVFRGRLRTGNREPLPMIGVLQAPEVDDETTSAGSGTDRVKDVLYLIQGWCEGEDLDNPTDSAHVLLAETKRVLGMIVDEDSAHYLLRSAHPDGEPLIARLSVSVGLVRPPEQAISDVSYFWLPVRIGFVEDITAPYDLP